MFTPEQILFCTAVAVCTAAATVRCARKNEAFQKKVFLALGGLINFVYPANYLSRYSFLSMAGFRTLFYHGAMVFMASMPLCT